MNTAAWSLKYGQMSHWHRQVRHERVRTGAFIAEATGLEHAESLLPAEERRIAVKIFTAEQYISQK